MIADEVFVALVELYLPFPHQVSVFYPLTMVDMDTGS